MHAFVLPIGTSVPETTDAGQRIAVVLLPDLLFLPGRRLLLLLTEAVLVPPGLRQKVPDAGWHFAVVGDAGHLSDILAQPKLADGRRKMLETVGVVGTVKHHQESFLAL